MTLDISGIYFFMPVFSFLLVFLIIYAVLAKTKVLGESNGVHLLISFIMAVIFMAFSSMRLYVETIIPWFIVLLVIVFLILLIAGLATKKLDDIMTNKFAWGIIIVFIVILILVAIKVFNPVLHPDLVITGGENGPGIISQLTELITASNVAGTILLLIIVGAVAWVISRK